MTQLEKNEVMKKLREEFRLLWDQKIKFMCKNIGLETWGEDVARDLCWVAFTHNKIPVVDKE